MGKKYFNSDEWTEISFYPQEREAHFFIPYKFYVDFLSLCFLVNDLTTLINTLERNLRVDGFVLVHDFRGFSPWLIIFITFIPVKKQKYHSERICREELLISWQPRGRERLTGTKDKI